MGRRRPLGAALVTRRRQWEWTADEADGGYAHRPVRPLQESLAEVAADLRLDAPDVLAAVLSRWSLVVGEAVAAHTRPRTLREGVLVVEVDTPAWATQFRYLENALLKRLGRKIRPGAVTGIRVVVRSSGP